MPVELQYVFPFFFASSEADSAHRDEEKHRSADFIIPKQMVQSEAEGVGGWQPGDLHVANLTLPLH